MDYFNYTLTAIPGINYALVWAQNDFKQAIEIYTFPIFTTEYFVSTQIALVLPCAYRTWENQKKDAANVKDCDQFVMRSEKATWLVKDDCAPRELIPTTWSMKSQFMIGFCDRAGIDPRKCSAEVNGTRFQDMITYEMMKFTDNQIDFFLICGGFGG